MFKVGDQVIHTTVPNVVWTVREVLADTCIISPNQEFTYLGKVYAKDRQIDFMQTSYLKHKPTVISKIRELEERHLAFLQEKKSTASKPKGFASVGIILDDIIAVRDLL